MKTIVSTTWNRRPSDPAMRAFGHHHNNAGQQRFTLEREFRITRGNHECLLGLLRPFSLR